MSRGPGPLLLGMHSMECVLLFRHGGQLLRSQHGGMLRQRMLQLRILLRGRKPMRSQLVKAVCVE